MQAISGIAYLSIITLLVLSNQLKKIYNVFGLKGLDFWMFELVFIYTITVFIFKLQIYRHKILSISIIIIFSTIMKLISLYISISNKENKIYIKYIWIIPIGISTFLIFIFMRSYAYCKLKWLFDIKYISPIKLLIVLHFIEIISTKYQLRAKISTSLFGKIYKI